LSKKKSRSFQKTEEKQKLLEKRGRETKEQGEGQRRRWEQEQKERGSGRMRTRKVRGGGARLVFAFDALWA
jgi:mRNA-degrading endonuclease RelE of RelBE toxin-antitoxin system